MNLVMPAAYRVERDLGQYITLRDVDSLNRLLKTTKHESFPAALQLGGSERIA
jgi:hypothetical protein